jgi:hypothetical protein
LQSAIAAEQIGFAISIKIGGKQSARSGIGRRLKERDLPIQRRSNKEKTQAMPDPAWQFVSHKCT